jgi:DNA-binding MarR family transcriptional regulator
MRTSSAARKEAALLRRSVTSLASRARAERRGELTLTQVAVLGRVAVDGPITPGEVAARLRIVPQSLTRPLAALESSGLVHRMPDPADGRGALLHVTREGLAALRAEMAPRDRWLAEAVATVCTADEQRILAAAAQIMLRVAAYGDGVAPIEP